MKSVRTLGWTYAGLVVPGYLATVFFAAPVTAVFIVAESIMTYLFVALIGRWITQTGAWSTARSGASGSTCSSSAR